MEYNFNSQYPYQWSGSFIPNGFNGANPSPHSTQSLHLATPPGQQPASAIHIAMPRGPTGCAGPPVFPLTANPASGAVMPVSSFNNLVQTGGIFPFGTHGTAYPNQTPAQQTPQFTTDWNYYSNISCYNQLPLNITLSGNNISGSQLNMPPFDNANQNERKVSNVSNKENSKMPEQSKDQLNEELIALKVSSFLNDPNLLKNAITRSLQNNATGMSDVQNDNLTSTESTCNVTTPTV